MRRLLTIILLVVTAISLTAVAEDARTIKRQRQTAQKEIKESTRRLERNKREVGKQMKRLSQLDTEIAVSDGEIERLQGELTQLDAGIAGAHRSIDTLNLQLTRMRQQYVKALRTIQARRPVNNPLGYVLSARSVADFFTRMRYLREFSHWRSKREGEILAATAELGEKRDGLARMQQMQSESLVKLNSQKVELKARQAQTDKLIAKLNRDGGELKAKIAKRKKQMEALNARLNAIVEADRKAREAARKKKSADRKKQRSKTDTQATQPKQGSTAELREADADRKLTGDFKSNKGRLLFPVGGKYRVVRGFGKSYYSSKVQTSHVGIDIQVAPGTKARAIYEGVVTNISHLDGFNTIVVVRHGSYLSVYVNLAGVTVKNGQKLKAGQPIGTVAPGDDGSTAVLQFGLRHERVELNPLEWVR